MTAAGLDRQLPPESERAPEDLWDLALVKWKPGVDAPRRASGTREDRR